jgi:hypothetical protein
MLRQSFRCARLFFAPFVLAALWALPGVAADSPGLTPEQAQALEERVRARWQTKVERDFGRTWEFSTPNFRDVFPKTLYVQKFSYMVEWELTSVSVVHYDADAAVASVAARVMTKPTKQTSTASRAIGAVPITIREQWILIDGQWWHSTND